MKRRALVLAMVLAGCAGSPPMRVYVLSPPAEPTPKATIASGRKLLELQRVAVPDYLDSTDINLRDGRNELKVSQTGRWGERLSLGVTDALGAGLVRRLPGYLVTKTASSAAVARRVVVDVDAFDFRLDGSCVLTARWTLLGDDRRTITARRDTFVVPAKQKSGDTTDAAVAAAMTAAIEQLADAIAHAVTGR